MIMFILTVTLLSSDGDVHTHYDSQYKSYDECRLSITKDKQMDMAIELREHIKDGTSMSFICMPGSNHLDHRHIAIELHRLTESVIKNSKRNKSTGVST